jgi:hypothetical protein
MGDAIMRGAWRYMTEGLTCKPKLTREVWNGNWKSWKLWKLWKVRSLSSGEEVMWLFFPFPFLCFLCFLLVPIFKTS